MDLSKFLSLVDKNALYFPRADKLGDPFEGSFTKPSLIDRNNLGDFSEFYQQLPTNVLVNCWHMNEHESEAMWKLYLKSDEGIVVQSTYDRLINAFDVVKDYHIFVGTVDYLDYDNDSFDISNTFNSFLRKRKSFEHERELRAIIDLRIENPGPGPNEEKVEHGKYIPIDILKLIECVYVAPYGPEWVLDLLKSLVTKLNTEITVSSSGLKAKPLF